jgi:hypothetical protein
MTTRYIVANAIIFSLAVGCSDEPHENPDAEGCEHLREGPAVALTAAAAAGSAPAIMADHQRYDVALVAVTGGMGGFVNYGAPEATDYLFFLDADVPVQFQDATSASVTPEDSAAGSTACADIKGRHLVPLEVGTYTIQIGPTTNTSVGIVVEEAAHEEH